MSVVSVRELQHFIFYAGLVVYN